MNYIETLESYTIANEGLFFNKNKSTNNSVVQQPRPKPGPSKDVVIRDMKKLYGIDIEEYPEDKFANKAAVINSIRQDVTNWVNKIKNSSSCRKILSDACADVKKKIDDEDVELSGNSDFLYMALVENYELSKNQITPAFILQYVKVSEGVNGWDTCVSLTTNECTQELNIFLNFICEDIGKMLTVTYFNYMTWAAATRDGDAGHVYYKLKTL